MTFLNPALLWGLAGLGIPVIIHLWGRRRPRRAPFPSLRLIKAGRQRQSSFARLRELLLLLLRMLLIALVVLAFARPVTDSPLLRPLGAADERAVVILDRSASMALTAGGGTPLERGVRAVQTIRDHLPERSDLPVLLAAGDLAPLPADESVARLSPTPGRCVLPDLLNKTQLEPIWDSRSRLYILTDLQETSLRGELVEALPRDPVVVDLGRPGAANVAVTDCVTRSECPVRDRPVELEFTLHTWGTHRDGRDAPVAVSLDGEQLPGQTVRVRRGVTRGRLRTRPSQGGDLAWTISSGRDALPFDDVYYHTERVRETVRAVILHGASSPRFLSLALDSGGETPRFTVSARNWAELGGKLPEADLLILADVPEAHPALAQIGRFPGPGKGVVVFTGPAGKPGGALLRRLLDAEVAVGGAVPAPSGAPLRLADVDTLSPALADFASPRAGDLAACGFTRRREITGADRADPRAWFSDASAAIIGTADPGRHAVLINTSLDAAWTDAPYQAAYVPLMHRLCYDVVGRAERKWQDWFVGRRMRVDLGSGVERVRVTDPSGASADLEARAGRVTYTPRLQGVYRAVWQVSGVERRERFAANINPLESDPARITAAELRRRLKAPQATVIRSDGLPDYLDRHGIGRADLTTAFLCLAVLALIAEALLSAGRRPRAEGEEPVA